MTRILVMAFAASLGAPSARVFADGQEPPVTLGEAIAIALRQSPDLAAHDAAVRLAGIAERLANADFATKFSPTLNGGTDPVGGKNRNVGLNVSKRLSTGGVVFGNVSSFEFGAAGVRDTGYTIGVSQPLLRGFSRTATANRDAATRRMDAALRERDDARAALVVRVSRLYFEVIKQERLNTAAAQAAARAATLREASEARTRVGLATELDVLRARILESRAAAAQADGRRALAAATDQLSLVLGRPLSALLRVDENSATAALAVALNDLPASLDDLVAIALADRADLAEARARAADATRQSSVARWNALPPLALDVSYTQRGLAGSTAGFNNLLDGWHIGVSTSYSLDRASENAAIENAAVAVDSASVAVLALEQQATAQVRALYAARQTAEATVAIHREAVDLAIQERDLAALRYERGLAGSLDVVGAETSLYQAQTALIAAELDQLIFALDLRRAVGCLDVTRLYK